VQSVVESLGPGTYNAPMLSTTPRQSLPFIARTLMPREIWANGTMAVALGALEGGVVGVLVKNEFESVAPTAWVNLAVALVAGAPAFANMASLTISGLAEGRDKTAWVSRLMVLTSIALIAMAFMPYTLAGLVGLTMAVVLARLAWAGVITLRAAIWRANFPRHVRAQITGRITVIYSMIIAFTAAALGSVMSIWPESWRWMFPICGVLGLIAALRYQRMRIRMGARLRRSEQAQRLQRQGGQFRAAFGILRTDVWFRRYMLTMFAFGSGNLMVIALLIIILSDQFGFAKLSQMLITTSLPLIGVAVFTPIWARRLDATHILDYRARQAWSFVLAIGLFALATILSQPWLFWAGAVALGAAFAGGKLGWNLGHNDFASDEQSTLYMGIHVTLTGIRGLIAPLTGVMVYQWLETLGDGFGRWVLLFPFALTLGAAVTFVILARLRRQLVSA